MQCRWLWRHLLRHCSGSIQCSIRSGMIRASKNSAKRNQSEDRQRTEHRLAQSAAKDLNDGGRATACSRMLSESPQRPCPSNDFASERLEFQTDLPAAAFKPFLGMRIWQTVRRHYAQGTLSRR